MKPFLLLSALSLAATTFLFGQQNYYDLIPGNGNGIRFWQSDGYKIHMGAGSEYQYGPVTDYSIKTNMSADPARGWTWGIQGQVPVAAMNTQGHMQIAGDFVLGGNTFDISSRWLRIGQGSFSGSPLNFGTNNKNGFASVWDTDGVFFGMSDEGPNRKDAVIAWGDDGNDMLRFLFNNNELMRLSPDGTLAIGTITPQARLHVASGGIRHGAPGQISIDAIGVIGGRFQILDNGNVGIGINAPSSRLHVIGSGGVQADVKVNGRIQTGDAANQGGVYLNSANNMFVGQVDATKVGLYNSAWRLIIDNTGKVGIGTSTPDEMLTVNGKINSEEIIVSPSVPAPDYVFEKNYDLPSLDEVQAYITQHKHLPEVPSAKDIEKDGLKVGEMEFILLKKIEEMTLYLIEVDRQLKIQQKKNLEMEQSNKAQKDEIEQLKIEILKASEKK